MADYSVGLSEALRSRAKETKWAIPVHSATGRVNFTSLTGRQYLLVQVGIPSNRIILSTVNIEIFAQYIFRTFHARSQMLENLMSTKKLTYNRSNRTNWYACRNLTSRKCLLRFDACMKI